MAFLDLVYAGLNRREEGKGVGVSPGRKAQVQLQLQIKPLVMTMKVGHPGVEISRQSARPFESTVGKF